MHRFLARETLRASHSATLEPTLRHFKVSGRGSACVRRYNRVEWFCRKVFERPSKIGDCESVYVALKKLPRQRREIGCLSSCRRCSLRRKLKAQLVSPASQVLHHSLAVALFIFNLASFDKGRVENRFSPALPHQTVHAIFPHTAFRCSSRQGEWGHPIRWSDFHVS